MKHIEEEVAMPKKPTAKNKEEKKGIIPSVKGGIESAKQGVKDILYGRSAEISPGKVAEKNRSTGEKIIASLSAVDFYTMKDKNLADPEQIDNMRMSVKALIVKLQNAPTIFDDVSELDTILLKAADTLKTAAEFGYVNQAEWCINAISSGLLLLRDNVPPQRQDAREEIIKKRVEYMKNYENLIIAYGKIDGMTQSIDSSKATLAKYKEDLAQQEIEMKEFMNTPEGNLANVHLNAYQNQPGSKLSEDDRKLELMGRKIGDLSTSIIRLFNQQYAMIMDNESQLTIAMGIRTALDNLPTLYDQDLLGEYAVLLKNINETTNRLLTDAAAVLEIEEDAAHEMTAIMNSSAAQKLTSYSAKAIENALAPKNRITERERLEAQLQISRRNRANQVAMENEEMLRKMMESLTANAELNRTVQENYDFSFAENTSENVQENTVEATDTLENTDDNDNLNYNVLS